MVNLDRLIEKLDKGVLGLSSILAAYIIDTPIHELGHYLSAKLFGGNAKIIIRERGPATVITFHEEYSYIKDLLITLGAPTLEVLTAYGLGHLARKIKGAQNQGFRYVSKLFSITLSWMPFYELISELITKNQNGDFYILNNRLNLPFEVTLPATLLTGGLLTYYNIRKEK